MPFTTGNNHTANDVKC